MSEIGSGRISFEDEVELAQAVEYVEDLLEGLRERRISVKRDGSTVILQPGRVVTMRVKVRQKKDREAILLELRWRTTVPVENQERFRVARSDPALEPAP